MKIINIQQGTKEWHAFRQCHLGASDSGAILGLNPWKTEKQVWEEKVLGFASPTNQKMIDGQKSEQQARNVYNALKGYDCEPVVLVDSVYDHISASLDGLSNDNCHAVEIKCGRSSHKLAQKGEIPKYYYSQLQHQIYVADLTGIDYFSFYDGDAITMRFHRDYEFIDAMLKKYNQFWEKVKKGEWYEL